MKNIIICLLWVLQFTLFFFLVGNTEARQDIAQSEEMISVMEELRKIKAAAQKDSVTEKKDEEFSNPLSLDNNIFSPNVESEPKTAGGYPSQSKSVDKDNTLNNIPLINKIKSNEIIFITDVLGMPLHVVHGKPKLIVEAIPTTVSAGRIFSKSNDKLYCAAPLLVDVFDVKTMDRAGRIEYDGHPMPRHSKAVITPDGTKMYIGVIGWGKGATRGVYVINLVKNKQMGLLEKNNIQSGFIDISKNGEFLFVLSNQGLKIIKTSSDKVVAKIKYNQRWDLRDVVVATESEVILSTLYMKGDIYNPDYDYKLIKLNIANFKNIKSQSIIIPEYANRIAYHPKNHMIYALTPENVLEVDLEKNSITKILSGNIGDVEFSKDWGRMYLSDEKNKQLIIYNLFKRKVERKIKMKVEPYEIIVF